MEPLGIHGRGQILFHAICFYKMYLGKGILYVSSSWGAVLDLPMLGRASLWKSMCLAVYGRQLVSLPLICTEEVKLLIHGGNVPFTTGWNLSLSIVLPSYPETSQQ